MASPCKKAKPGMATTSPETGFIRMCDAFIRTVGNVISPTRRAEESVSVLYKLQKDLLEKILKEAGIITGLKLGSLEWRPVSSDLNGGNIFMTYEAVEKPDANKFEEFRKYVTTKLEQLHNVKNILIHKLENASTILQPIISERDFDLYKLKLSHEGLLKAAGDSAEKTGLFIASESIKSQLEDVKENRTKIAVLSQNGKGKSFFLNLLFLLTADTEQEYVENSKHMKLPKDITGDPTIANLSEEDLQMLPTVLQDIITKIRENEMNEENKKHLKAFAEPLIHELSFSHNEDYKKSEHSLSGMKKHFMGTRTVFEPYILAQKDIEGSYNSTTKCVIHLRYGALHQMKVEYFKAEDLQFQLFELVTLMGEESSSKNSEIRHDRKERSFESLKTRLALLTDLIDEDDDDEERFNNVIKALDSTEDIILSNDVKEFAGKTELYIGNGKNSTMDRLALKAILKELTTSQEKNEDEIQKYRKKIAAVKKIVVYIPSKILIGKEILEMPGTDESDAMAIDCISSALNTVDIIFLLSEFALKIGEKEVKEILADSSFLKKILEEPTHYKLMLLSYPEKQNNWQYGINDQTRIQKLVQEEEKKRREELKVLNKIIKDKRFSKNLNEDSIYTSYILPVLHTSIHSQEGEPHEIIENYNGFLKYTGINKLIIALDQFVAKKQENAVLEVADQLKKLQNEMNRELSAENARQIMSLCQNRELKIIREAELARQNEQLLTELRKNLEIIIHSIVNNELKELLSETSIQARKTWEENESRVTTMGVFNPYFYGKNPIYRVKIYNILFEGLVDKTKPCFQKLIRQIMEALSNYQKEAIGLFIRELNDLLAGNSEATQDFVVRTVTQSLEDAMTWYMGKKNLPFNERTLDKYFEKSLGSSLREKMLEPAYKIKDLPTAKETIKKNIWKTIEDVKEQFLAHLIDSLHKKRFKSLSGKLKDKNGNPRMWLLLMGKIKALSKNREILDQLGELNKAIQLISVRL